MSNSEKNMVRLIGLALMLFGGFVLYGGMPTFSFDFVVQSTLPFIMIAAGLGGVIIGSPKPYIFGGSTLVVVVLFSFFRMMINDAYVFNDDKHYSLIGEVHQSEFRKDIQPVNLTDIRTVDFEAAERRAEELLGADLGLGSQLEMGTMTLQKVNGKFVYVSILEPSGFMKWYNGVKSGYIVVSATNIQDAKIVTNKSYKYTLNSWFGDNIKRHVWGNGYASVAMTDFSVELTDDNKLMWVITKYEPKIGNAPSSNDATGVIIVDPETGDINDYDMENIPSWVDNVQPAEFVTEQLKSYGKLGKGWKNQSMFGDKSGVMKPTDTMVTVAGSDGDTYFYTGMTSIGKDSASSGYMLINKRTKRTTFYAMAGPTEIAVRDVLNGLVSNFSGYRASNVVFYNINGFETYFAPIKDANGIVKKYGLASAKVRDISAMGDTLEQAVQNYMRVQRIKNKNQTVVGVSDQVSVSGVVTRMYTEKSGDVTTVNMMVDGKYNNVVFKFSVDQNVEIGLTKIGDKVQFKTNDDGKTNILYGERFDNKQITLR